MTDWQTIAYDGRLAAAVGPDECIGSSWICALPADHPVRRFVEVMCAYAGAVLDGDIAGPYSDERAAEWARAVLIPESELLTFWQAPDWCLAERFGVPIEQVAARREDVHRAFRGPTR